MALLAMANTGQRLRPAVLESFEHEIGSRLPEEYRQFLLTYNGGRPEPDGFNFKGSTAGSDVHSFLGLNTDEHKDMRRFLGIYSGRLPTKMLPVAYDSGGNVICIALEGTDRGKVYFWDHETEADLAHGETPDSADNIIPIADSFDEFIEGLSA